MSLSKHLAERENIVFRFRGKTIKITEMSVERINHLIGMCVESRNGKLQRTLEVELSLRALIERTPLGQELK